MCFSFKISIIVSNYYWVSLKWLASPKLGGYENKPIEQPCNRPVGQPSMHSELYITVALPCSVEWSCEDEQRVSYNGKSEQDANDGKGCNRSETFGNRRGTFSEGICLDWGRRVGY